MPIAWHLLHDYQQNRVLTFLNPERDPLGAGYHIIQSKIALGSGGVFGKGFLKGTQSHLNFLPEKHTDFIFTMLSEEFGLIGATFVVIVNFLIIAYSYSFFLYEAPVMEKLAANLDWQTNFLYVFCQWQWFWGPIPVVVSPLPLILLHGERLFSRYTVLGLFFRYILIGI